MCKYAHINARLFICVFVFAYVTRLVYVNMLHFQCLCVWTVAVAEYWWEALPHPFPMTAGTGWHCGVALHLRQRKNSTVLVFKFKNPFSKKKRAAFHVLKSYSSPKHCSTFKHASDEDTRRFDLGLTYWPRKFNFNTFFPQTSAIAPFISQPYSLIQFMNYSIDYNWAFTQAI